MATVEKHESARGHNGHSSHSAGAKKSGAGHEHASGSRRTRRKTQTGLDRIVLAGRELPRRFEAQLKNNPAAVIAAVGAGAFLLGGLLVSKLGRLALAAAIPYAVESAFQGVLGEKIGDYARGLVEGEGEAAR
jgi:hypothetical protein